MLSIFGQLKDCFRKLKSSWDILRQDQWSLEGTRCQETTSRRLFILSRDSSKRGFIVELKRSQSYAEKGKKAFWVEITAYGKIQGDGSTCFAGKKMARSPT